MFPLDDYQGAFSSSVPLSRLTTWKTGGPADWLAKPASLKDLCALMQAVYIHELPWFVLGYGSNVLFSDAGFRGVVIVLGDGFEDIQISENNIVAGARAALKAVANTAADHALTGLECLAGIPGTVGGAARMNAGAHGVCILDFCREVRGVTHRGEITKITDIRPGYRSGGFPDDVIITELILKLTPGDPDQIHQRMSQYLEQRRSAQPLSEASAGCTFKNPSGDGAGRLIDRLGLKGFQNGRAVVSEKHANFIINSGGATASEIIELIKHVRSRVMSEYGVQLELEVQIVDEYGRPVDLWGESHD